MPGPPVSTILTSNDVGLGANEMKVKGTYVNPTAEKFISSRFLFTSVEDEEDFFKRNPDYKGFLDLDDIGKQRGPDIPYKMKHQLDEDIGEKVAGSTPKKPRFQKSTGKAIRLGK